MGEQLGGGVCGCAGEGGGPAGVVTSTGETAVSSMLHCSGGGGSGSSSAVTTLWALLYCSSAPDGSSLLNGGVFFRKIADFVLGASSMCLARAYASVSVMLMPALPW